jgi:hypothetical protein
MNAFSHLVLLAFVPLVWFVARRLDRQIAIVGAAVAGLLFLPNLTIPTPGFLDFGKFAAISLALAVSAGCSRGQPVQRFQPNLWDALVVSYVVAVPLSYLSNGMAAYSAVSALIYSSIDWIVPYWVGRRHLSDERGLRILLWGFFVGGLAYVPFCLWEVRMSPLLHLRIYGEFVHSFQQMVRAGGYRPIVFLGHGLEVALWMSTATIACLVLWRRLLVRSVQSISMGWLFVLMAVTLLLCKSLGSILLAITMVPVVLSRRGPLLLSGFVVAGVGYLALRVFAGPQVYGTIAALSELAPAERAESMMFRVDMEEILMQQAWMRPLLGWTIEQKGVQLDPWADPETRQRLITDSRWIIAFLGSGLLGLLSLYGLLAGVCIKVWYRLRWDDGAHAECLGVAVAVAITMFDTLSNATISPPVILSIGALAAMRSERAVSTAARGEQVGDRAVPPVLRPRARTKTLLAASDRARGGPDEFNTDCRACPR